MGNVNKTNSKELKGLYVEVSNNGDKTKNLEYALKKLKRMIKDDNLLVTVYEKSFFTKPSAKRRVEKAKSYARMKSVNRKNNK